MTTGPQKTDGAHGEHWLSPTVVALFERHRAGHAVEREGRRAGRRTTPDAVAAASSSASSLSCRTSGHGPGTSRARPAPSTTNCDDRAGAR